MEFFNIYYIIIYDNYYLLQYFILETKSKLALNVVRLTYEFTYNFWKDFECVVYEPIYVNKAKYLL